MRQDSSHRLATLLRAAQVSLDGVDDTLVRSDRLRGWADTLRARLIDRQGLDFARRRWGAALFGMQHFLLFRMQFIITTMTQELFQKYMKPVKNI